MRPGRVVSLLDGFLGTYTSRYSDYNGYWLFGFVVEEVDRLVVDLLLPAPQGHGEAPHTKTIELAISKFKEQSTKARIDLALFREASLTILRSPHLWKPGEVRARRIGYDLEFTARARPEGREALERKVKLVVSPHNPNIELKSVRSAARPDQPESR